MTCLGATSPYVGNEPHSDFPKNRCFFPKPPLFPEKAAVFFCKVRSLWSASLSFRAELPPLHLNVLCFWANLFGLFPKCLHRCICRMR